MSSVVAFLTNRVAEDEILAEAGLAAGDPDRRWIYERLLDIVHTKRAVLSELEQAQRGTDTSWTAALSAAVHTHAAEYAGHPDFQDDWLAHALTAGPEG